MKKTIFCLMVLIFIFSGCLDRDRSGLSLTNEEMAWLKAHPVIYYASDPEFAPFEFLDENNAHKGIASDYLRKLETLLGIRFELTVTETWNESLEKGISNEVNMLFMAKTHDRLRFFEFTDAFVFSPNIFLVNSERIERVDFDRMEEYRIGVLESYANRDYLLILYPEVKPVDYDSVVEGLMDLSNGKIDIFLSDLALATHYINRYGIQNLLLLDSLGYDLELSFAINKAYAPLTPIINKALEAIPQSESESINEKWNSIEYKNWINRKQERIIYSTILVIVLLLLLLLILSYILRKMVKERTKELEFRVKERTRALEESLDKLKKTQDDLVQAEKFASLGHVVSSVAHELNTPIGNLLTSLSYGTKKAEMLKRACQNNTLTKSHLEDALNELDDIYIRGIKNLEYTIGVLDRFKRLEATLISDYKVRINLKEAIETIIQVMYARGEIDTSIKLHLDLTEVYIEANILWIEEIVENLVLNSLLHNPHRPCSIGIKLFKEEEVVLSVSDDGIGIEAHVVPHIFEPFYKQSQGYQSSGLGLTIVHNIVYKNLNGHIEVFSEPNKKTEFVLKFPILI